MCAKMPILIESVGDQGQRVEQGFEWPDDSALKRVEKAVVAPFWALQDTTLWPRLTRANFSA
jgi:hypothetical protein